MGRMMSVAFRYSTTTHLAGILIRDNSMRVIMTAVFMMEWR